MWDKGWQVPLIKPITVKVRNIVITGWEQAGCLNDRLLQTFPQSLSAFFSPNILYFTSRTRGPLCTKVFSFVTNLPKEETNACHLYLCSTALLKPYFTWETPGKLFSPHSPVVNSIFLSRCVFSSPNCVGLFQLLGWTIENEESVKGEDWSGKVMTDKGEGTHL